MVDVHEPEPGDDKSDRVDRVAHTEAGLCASPLSWDEARSIVADGSLASMRLFGRSRDTLQSYREFKSRINRFYASMVDRIMIDVFKCDWKVNEDRKIQHLSPSQAGPFFVKNDFPYNLDPGIEHYLLWSDRVMLDEEVEAYLRSDPRGPAELVVPDLRQSGRASVDSRGSSCTCAAKDELRPEVDTGSSCVGSWEVPRCVTRSRRCRQSSFISSSKRAVFCDLGPETRLLAFQPAPASQTTGSKPTESARKGKMVVLPTRKFRQANGFVFDAPFYPITCLGVSTRRTLDFSRPGVRSRNFVSAVVPGLGSCYPWSCWWWSQLSSSTASRYHIRASRVPWPSTRWKSARRGPRRTCQRGTAQRTMHNCPGRQVRSWIKSHPAIRWIV